jgi:hypothetical protein
MPRSAEASPLPEGPPVLADPLIAIDDDDPPCCWEEDADASACWNADMVVGGV